MNITKAFAEYLEDVTTGVFGTDLFIGGAPLDAPSTCWWVVSAGGASDPKNISGERLKNYIVNIFYRNLDGEAVYETLQALEEEINSKHCTQLNGYDTLDMEAIIFPADQDLDVQERTVGLLQVSLNTHQS